MKVKISSAVVLLFMIFDAFIGQTTVKRILAETKQTKSSVSNQMPNLQGDEAKQFLEQQDLDKSLGAAIQAARYSVNWVESAPVSNGSGAFEAKNMQQEFAAYFSNDGVKLVSRETSEKRGLSLKLTGYGRGEQIEPVGDGEIKTEKNRVERMFGVPPRIPEAKVCKQ